LKNKPPTECTSCGVTLSVRHLTTKCRSNEEEREKHNIPMNLYEIIGPDCQPENTMSFDIPSGTSTWRNTFKRNTNK